VPNGMSTHSNPAAFQDEGAAAIGANTWTHVDELPPTAPPGPPAPDYIQQVTEDLGGVSYVGLTFGDTTSSCIQGVQAIETYSSSSNGTNHGAARILDGATTTTIYEGNMSDIAVQYATLRIPRAGGWTQAALNGLIGRVGYSTNVNKQPYWHQLTLEYATGASVPGTVTVTASAGSSQVTTSYQDVGAGTPVLSTWTTTR
jgi:hypothetical protein